MPTRRIADPSKVCTDPDHYPPKYAVFDDGLYEHTCPSCNFSTVFTVPTLHLAPRGRLG